MLFVLFSVNKTLWDKTDIKRGMQEPHADIFHGSGWRLVQERYDIKWKFLLQRFSSPSGDW